MRRSMSTKIREISNRQPCFSGSRPERPGYRRLGWGETLGVIRAVRDAAIAPASKWDFHESPESEADEERETGRAHQQRLQPRPCPARQRPSAFRRSDADEQEARRDHAPRKTVRNEIAD